MTYVMFILSELAVIVLPKLSLFKKHNNSDLLLSPHLDRRLSQPEIDELVNYLLSRRKRSFSILSRFRG
jgi:hypothetical protein